MARNKSISKAAQELSVTQTAVSHQVRQLCEYFDAVLYERTPRGVSLTADGEELAKAASAALDTIEAATARVLRHKARVGRRLVLRVTPLFSRTWLAPHLGDFMEGHPDIDLILQHSQLPLSVDADGWDVAITHGDVPNGPYESYFLKSELLVPWCSPTVAARRQDEWRASDLSSEVLIAETFGDCWSAWFSEFGERPYDDGKRVFSDDPHFAIESAVRGEGWILESENHLKRHRENRSLVSPFGKAQGVKLAYYFVRKTSNVNQSDAENFEKWIRDKY